MGHFLIGRIVWPHVARRATEKPIGHRPEPLPARQERLAGTRSAAARRRHSGQGGQRIGGAFASLSEVAVAAGDVLFRERFARKPGLLPRRYQSLF